MSPGSITPNLNSHHPPKTRIGVYNSIAPLKKFKEFYLFVVLSILGSMVFLSCFFFLRLEYLRSHYYYFGFRVEQGNIDWSGIWTCDRWINMPAIYKRHEGNSWFINYFCRLNFSTAWSTNAVSMCQSAGLTQITRVERSLRYFIMASMADGSGVKISSVAEREISGCLHDRMTECRYAEPLESFAIEVPD